MVSDSISNRRHRQNGASAMIKKLRAQLMALLIIIMIAGACSDCDSPVAVGSDAYCNSGTVTE